MEIRTPPRQPASPPSTNDDTPASAVQNASAQAESSQAAPPQAAPDPAIPLSLPIDPPEHHHKRTPGLKLFDVVLYPLLTNVGVFAISVVATYLTNKGGEKNAAGELVYGKAGEFIHKRGDWLVKKLKAMGVKSDKSADSFKMVALSFFDGSIMAFPIKMLEDRREKIAHWCDKKMGTAPEDSSVYENEPKQSWTSLLGGRFVTAGIVVPTAVALNSKVLKNDKGEKVSFNEKMFNEPGVKMGEWVRSKPSLSKAFGRFDAGELARISIFEAFYTSVCTTGLYFSSRLFAKKLNQHQENKALKAAAHAHPAGASADDTASLPAQPAAPSAGETFISTQERTAQWAGDKVRQLTSGAETPSPRFAQEKLRNKPAPLPAASQTARYEASKQETLQPSL